MSLSESHGEASIRSFGRFFLLWWREGETAWWSTVNKGFYTRQGRSPARPLAAVVGTSRRGRGRQRIFSGRFHFLGLVAKCRRLCRFLQPCSRLTPNPHIHTPSSLALSSPSPRSPEVRRLDVTSQEANMLLPLPWLR